MSLNSDADGKESVPPPRCPIVSGDVVASPSAVVAFGGGELGVFGVALDASAKRTAGWPSLTMTEATPVAKGVSSRSLKLAFIPKMYSDDRE